MEFQLLRIFQAQVQMQCSIARHAYRDMHAIYDRGRQESYDHSDATRALRKVVRDANERGDLDALHEAYAALGELTLPSSDPDAIWTVVQGLLNAAANVTKLLGGRTTKDGEFLLLSQRAALRDSLNVPDDSPLLTRPMVRNSWEHIDERLEKWWRKSATRNYVEFIGPLQEAEQVAESDRFRIWDPDQDRIVFWGYESDLTEILPALEAIESRARDQLG